MKKVLAGMALLFACSAVNAQSFYVLGGVNLANITKNSEGHTEDNNTLTTFNAGLMARFGLSSVVDLESGLVVNGHGAKAESYFNGGNDYVKARFNPVYLEVPLNLVVMAPISKSANFFAHAGPYIAMGIGGKSKRDTKVGPLTSSSESSIKFSNDDPFTSQQDDAAYDKLKRFDFGANLGAGIRLSRIMLRANYGFGLAKINSTESNNSADDKNKYRTLSLSVGIPIGK